MQIDVARLHLLPEAICLLFEGLGRHVVAEAPEPAEVGESNLPRALVGEPHQSLVQRPHLGGDGVPAVPRLEELNGTAALRHHFLELEEIAKRPLPVLSAVLALAVEALEPRGDLRELS